MNETQNKTTVPSKRGRWLKILGVFFGLFILLLLAGYLVGTSSGFLKSFILPRVSKAANATITVEDASLSPFSEIILRNLKVETTGAEPLISATEVRVRYHLMDMLRGNFDVDEVAVVSPVINLVENADGTSNLDPLLKSSTAKKPETSAKPAKPAQINLKKFVLSNATLRRTQNHKDGPADVTELSNLNITLDDLKNGASGKFTVGADLKMSNHPPLPAIAGTLAAKLAGSFGFTLAADLKPLSLAGNTHFEVTQAGGALENLAALQSDFDCEVSPAEIKQIALHFQKSGAQLGVLKISGPFDAEKMEGKLNVELLGLDRQLLNLAGAGGGLDFDGTTINATNQIELSKSGAVITASGDLSVANFQITRAGQVSPVLYVHSEYSATVDRTSQTALLRTLVLNTTQNQNPLAHVELSAPMSFNWGNAASTTGDSALSVDVTAFNLADWRAFAAGLAPAGLVNAKIKLISQQGGKRLAMDLNGQVTDLSAGAGSNLISHADVSFQAKASGADFKKFNLESCRLNMAQRGDSALTISGSGTFDGDTHNADFQISVQSVLVKLLAIFPQPTNQLASGLLDFKGSLSSTGQGQSIKGELVLTNLSAAASPGELFAATLNLDASVSRQIAELHQCLVTLTPTSRAKNQLSLTGTIDLSQPAAFTGGLKLAADALDVTGYYDMLTGQTAPQPKAQPAVEKAPLQKEPDAVKLPFNNFTVDAAIGRIYLRELDVSNLQATLKLDDGKVVLKPFQMALNGAPVNASAELNLGVRGYEYNLQFKADGVPIGPLTDTFSPDYKGKAEGTLIANGQITGAGITGVNLQKNLAGNASVILTNANVQLAGPKVKKLIAPIVAVLNLNELTTAPIVGLNAQIKAGGGKINVTQCDVLSTVFRASMVGVIPIAPVLNDSPFDNWPINFSLSRSLASNARLLSANTPANVAFVQLPTFVTLGGTIGNPVAKTDKLVIATLLYQSAIGLTKGGDAVKILQGVGSLLNGQKTQTATNHPPTNASPADKLLDLFKK